MGAGEIVGLTEKGARLDQAMRAAFTEFVTEANPEGFVVEEGALEAVRNRFDRIWKQAGIKRSPIHDGIIGALEDGPKTFSEIFDFMKYDAEYDDFRRMGHKAFSKAAKAMLDADLLTGDKRRIWTLE